MTMMAGDLYKALLAANVPEDKALKAATEVAGVRDEGKSLDTRLTRLEWMVGTLVALHVAEVTIFISFALNHMAFK